MNIGTRRSQRTSPGRSPFVPVPATRLDRARLWATLHRTVLGGVLTVLVVAAAVPLVLMASPRSPDELPTPPANEVLGVTVTAPGVASGDGTTAPPSTTVPPPVSAPVLTAAPETTPPRAPARSTATAALRTAAQTPAPDPPLSEPPATTTPDTTVAPTAPTAPTPTTEPPAVSVPTIPEPTVPEKDKPGKRRGKD